MQIYERTPLEHAMSLMEFGVVHAHQDPLERVLVHCYNGDQVVLVFIEREAIDDYFRRSDLASAGRKLLIDRHLQGLTSIIQEKFDAGEVGVYTDRFTGRSYPQIDLYLADLERTPEPMTDSVLETDAHAGFQRA
jgi:hypothetical protein